MYVHANLAPIKAMVREDVLYNMDVSHKNNFINCEIIGVSSYKGSVPTFQIVVDKESIFSYVPPHLLLQRRVGEQETQFNHFDLNDLVYHNCPSPEFALIEIDYLKKPMSAYLRSQKSWSPCVYLFTMDWHEGNDLLHCIAIDNGQFAFLPSHKLSLGKKEFQPYLKLKQEWRV